MNDWLTALSELLEGGQRCALITVADTRGSTPREVGSKMVVTRDASVGSIGGGHLEFKATQIAREMLANGDDARTSLRRFPLGPSLGQCCGGVAVLSFETVAAGRASWVQTVMALRQREEPLVLVSRTDAPSGDDKLVVTARDRDGGLGDARLESQALPMARSLMDGGAELRSVEVQGQDGTVLLFEPMRASDFHIELFGAGHVGRALIRVLEGLACSIRWIDSRQAQFPRALPSNVITRRSDEPEYEVDGAPPGSVFLVMTHRHSMDQAICERILRRRDFLYCGLIGSASKRRKFEKRLLARGVPGETLARLTCPIGVGGISGKQPGEIAIAVAAEILQTHERAGSANSRIADSVRD